MANSEAAVRRRRTDAYCRMWALPVPPIDEAVRVMVAADATLRAPVDVRDRALVQCLLGLKGQGLAHVEVFAFADAYALWDAMAPVEHDWVLEPDALRSDVVQMAWRFEQANVLLWSLGLVRHLHLPDQVVDPATIVAAALPALADRAASMTLRPTRDLLDGADVALRLDALLRADPSVPLDRGVVHERRTAFRWLTGLND